MEIRDGAQKLIDTLKDDPSLDNIQKQAILHEMRV